MGEFQPIARSELSLSTELLADCVTESSERFNEGIPWAWMLETILVATGCDRGAILEVCDDGSARVAAEVGRFEAQEREAILANRAPHSGWSSIQLTHASRAESAVWVSHGPEPLALARWLNLVRPVWAAMISARRAEERRHAMEASYRDLFEGAADALFVADASLRYVAVNKRACDALGYTQEELLAMRVNELVAPDDLASAPLRIAGLDRGEMVRSSRQLVCKGGSRRWFELATRRLPDGRYVSVARDVDEQRLAAERLRLSEEGFRALIQAMPDGIVIHRDGQIVYANRAAHTMLRVPEGARLEGRPVLSILHPDDAPVVMARIRAMMSGAETVPAQDERFLRDDGSVVHAEVLALRSVFQGEPVVVAVGRDRTETLRIRAELAHADRSATVGRLAAGVAHEINNPLAYVTLQLSSLPRQIESLRGADAAAREATVNRVSEALRTVGEGLDRVRRIVRDLKTYSRQDEERFSSVDLVSTLESALNLASHEISQHASLVRDYTPIPVVRGVEGRLCQVFLNLLVNAAQAIPLDGGHHEVRVSVRREGVFARVDVRDDGVGMSPQIRERIFEPFFTTRRTSDGMGLGLSISADIVSAHGGSIEVETAPGRGTCLTVRLPLGDRGSAVSSAPRVLVVDAAAASVSAIVRALCDRCALITASSAVDARGLLSTAAPFDAALCDGTLVDDRGRALTATIAAEHPALPLAVTAPPLGGEFAEDPTSGRVVLQKPFTADAVNQCVDALLARS